KMLRKPTKAKGGPVPQRPPAPDFTATDKRAKEVVREMERPLRVALKGCGAAMFVILAFFLIAAIFVPGVIPAKITLSKAALEQKQLGDLNWALRDALTIQGAESRLQRNVGEADGAAFWHQMLRHKLVEADILGKLVSLNSPGDIRAEGAVIDGSSLWRPEYCSYTAPRGSELAALLKRAGDERCVLITFNARNWDNYEEYGVIVLWSDGEGGEWL